MQLAIEANYEKKVFADNAKVLQPIYQNENMDLLRE